MRKSSMAGPASIGMASQGEAFCVLEGVVRGHHVYKATWPPKVGEILAVCEEPGHDHIRVNRPAFSGTVRILNTSSLCPARLHYCP